MLKNDPAFKTASESAYWKGYSRSNEWDLETLRKVALGLETFLLPKFNCGTQRTVFEMFDTSERTNEFCGEILSIYPEDWADCFAEYKSKLEGFMPEIKNLNLV